MSGSHPIWEARFNSEPYAFDIDITDGVVFVGTADHEGDTMSPETQLALYEQLRSVYEEAVPQQIAAKALEDAAARVQEKGRTDGAEVAAWLRAFAREIAGQ